VSTEFPRIKVLVDGTFSYLGQFPFKIAGVAGGERYVFAELNRGSVNRLFIAQFESFLPESHETYNYSFADAPSLGGHRFRQNEFAYSNRQAKAENPEGEGVLTANFLSGHGYRLEDELMASRFVTVPDPERKHELILFYIENVSSSGHRLEEFYVGEEGTPVWAAIAKGLATRSLESFKVVN
jgi:hypothetical protein